MNSNFSNEIDVRKERPQILPVMKNEILYRCGYCHQTSNWKHVIEVSEN